MIDGANRMEVTRKAIKHIYMAEIMMRMVCHSTGCSRCPFYNANAQGAHSCFYAQFEDVRATFPTLADMLIVLDDEPKHSKPIAEMNNANKTVH